MKNIDINLKENTITSSNVILKKLEPATEIKCATDHGFKLRSANAIDSAFRNIEHFEVPTTAITTSISTSSGALYHNVKIHNITAATI
jgi:hypothetical protein